MQEFEKSKVREERRVPVGLREEMEPFGYRFPEMGRWFEEPYREFENVFREPLLWPFGARIGPFVPTLRTVITPSLLPRYGEIRTPLVDIEDKGTEFIVTAELPGIPKENVEVNVTDESLEIRADIMHEEEKKAKEYHRKERVYKEIYRHVPLPGHILPAKVEAKLENGLLEILLPKKEPTPVPKKMKVKIE